MIFVTLGSQKFQFNRLLQTIDNFIEEKKIEEDIFAQIGYSDYRPQNYKYKKFLEYEEFVEMEEKASIVITHGGTGAIIGAVKKNKKVIAVPRLSKYGEHVDDHQLQLISQFSSQNLICGVKDCKEIVGALEYVKEHKFEKYQSNTQSIISSIDKYIIHEYYGELI